MLRSMYRSRSGFERFLNREKTSKPATRAPATKLPATAPDNVAIDNHEFEDFAWARLLLGLFVLVAEAAEVDGISTAGVVLKADESKLELKVGEEASHDAEILVQVLSETFMLDDKLVETGERALVAKTATELDALTSGSELVGAVEGGADAEVDEGLASRLDDEFMLATSKVVDLSL